MPILCVKQLLSCKSNGARLLSMRNTHNYISNQSSWPPSDAGAVPSRLVLESLGKAHLSGMQSGNLFPAFRCWAGSSIIACCTCNPLHMLLQSQLMSQLRHYGFQCLVVLVESLEGLMAHLVGTSNIHLDWYEIQNSNPMVQEPSEMLRWGYYAGLLSNWHTTLESLRSGTWFRT